ncbi:MAG: alpha/beta hydrolase, partial [Ruminococcaceae bacterium]|nr:alpha/beta hydrolase [Oscillospiraceae bacterium]
MLYEKIPLDKEDADAFLEIYVADTVGDFVRDAILVIPGGGYGTVCAEREGEPIAMAFLPYGYNAFVLHYSVRKKPFPAHLIQASRAMKHIRDNAEKYNIDPRRVFTVGFSAGGHLAASLGTMWDRKEIYAAIDMPFGYNKPDGMMLIYPVISATFHLGSFKNLLMEDGDDAEKLKMCSIENCVSENASPAYIVHTANDQVVDVRSSLVLANAMAEKGIKFEMHIYPDAPHGVALGNQITKCGVEKWANPSIAKWIHQAVAWAEGLRR